MRMSTAELVLILAVVLLIFGPRQIPRLARIAGEGVKGLRKAVRKTDLLHENTDSENGIS